MMRARSLIPPGPTRSASFPTPTAVSSATASSKAFKTLVSWALAANL